MKEQLWRKLDPRSIGRRWFLEQCGVGLGAVALGQLLGEAGYAAPLPSALDGPLAPRAPHFPPKTKNIIFLFMAGAPSHLDLFDHKPQLAKFDGTLPPEELLKDYRAAFINPNSKLLGPRFSFSRHGQSGVELSELLPHTATVVDDIAIVKSMVTDAFNHAPGQLLINTGIQQFGRPSMGAWVTYGLGSEARICLPLWSSALERRVPVAGIPAGAADSCPRFTRAFSFAPVAIPCSIFPIPRAWTGNYSAIRWTRFDGSMKSIWV